MCVRVYYYRHNQTDRRQRKETDTYNMGGALVVWSRRSIATLEDRSSILREGNNNVLVTKSDWPTLVGSVLR